MEPALKAFWLPKKGNSTEEYEDASAHSARLIAIADGATESAFADRWAQGLVKRFVESPPSGNSPSSLLLEKWLSPLQKEWHKSIAWDKLPWYAEEKARSGAFAAFLGVRLMGEEPSQASAPQKFSLWNFFFPKKQSTKLVSLKWQAVAIGDSNLFLIRSDALVKSFPIERSEQFDSRPLLLSSNPSKNRPVWQRVQMTEGDCGNGDVMLLMTDALAAWFLKRHEAGEKPWKALGELRSDQDFSEFIEQQRTNTSMRNDDVTLVISNWK